jgi:hypothetical protein
VEIPTKRHTTRLDELPAQNALAFYANPQQLKGGTFAGCTELVGGNPLVQRMLCGLAVFGREMRLRLA